MVNGTHFFLAYVVIVGPRIRSYNCRPSGKEEWMENRGGRRGKQEGGEGGVEGERGRRKERGGGG